jgi:hypothetical protein
MHADFSVELGRDDAALELPWNSTDPAVRFYDLKKHPELLQQIPEAVAWPELGAFLARINAAGFPLATAKCDAWQSREVAPEEEIFGDRKFVSYVDLVFEGEAERCSFEKHEAFAKDLCRLLSQAPEIPAAVEIVIRRCYYHGAGGVAAGLGDGGELEKEFKAEAGAEARDDAAGAEEVAGARVATDAGEAADAGDRVETSGEVAVSEAHDAGHRVETRRATEINDAADAEDVDEQQSGAANRESTERGGGSERTKQGADVEHGMKYEGGANADQRVESDIERADAAESSDQAAGEEGLSGLDGSVSGFYFTAYVSGFGDSDHDPGLRWQIALALVQNALVQLARETRKGV